MKVLDTGVGSAQENMRLDAELLETLGDEPILHFYEWEKKSITYGYFTKPESLLNLDAARAWGIDLAKRPTGGGVVFHLWDFAFSVLIPASSPHFSQNTLENYAYINGAVLRTVSSCLQGSLELTSLDAPTKNPTFSHFCMARPTKYDLVLNGKKIAGAAQRKTRKGFLHQGTIALTMPSESLLHSLLIEAHVADAIFSHTCPLLFSHDEEEISRTKGILKTLLRKNL